MEVNENHVDVEEQNKRCSQTVPTVLRGTWKQVTWTEVSSISYARLHPKMPQHPLDSLACCTHRYCEKYVRKQRIHTSRLFGGMSPVFLKK